MSQKINLANIGGNFRTTDSNWKGLFKVSGVAALLVGALLLLAMISLIATSLQPGTINGWLSLLQNNWLIVLFKLNAGFTGIQFELLHGLNLVDISIMIFVATLYLGLYTALKSTSKLWSIVAAVQPVLGIVLFMTTQQMGRSAVMGAGLVISLVMLRNNIFSKVIAFLGILSSVFLLIGDFGTTANSHSSIRAVLIGIGYVLLMTWFFVVAQRLFQLGKTK
jgi:hypothetical protein